jgi:hypothetical protein
MDRADQLKTVEIQELREAGEDGGELMGYFCRGHVERHLFAEAANRYSGALDHYDIRNVRPEKCRHVWWRTVQMEGEPKGTQCFKPSVPGPGAWAATVCESVADHSSRSVRLTIKEFDRGRGAGIAEGVNWALRFLENKNIELHDAMLKAYREQREKLESAA